MFVSPILRKSGSFRAAYFFIPFRVLLLTEVGRNFCAFLT